MSTTTASAPEPWDDDVLGPVPSAEELARGAELARLDALDRDELEFEISEEDYAAVEPLTDGELLARVTGSARVTASMATAGRAGSVGAAVAQLESPNTFQPSEVIGLRHAAPDPALMTDPVTVTGGEE